MARCTSPALSLSVLPSSRVRNPVNSVFRVSRIWEALLRMRPRATDVIAAQPANAFFAASIAAAASSFPLDAYSATTSRVSAGLTLREVCPDFAGVHSPPMKF